MNNRFQILLPGKIQTIDELLLTTSGKGGGFSLRRRRSSETFSLPRSKYERGELSPYRFGGIGGNSDARNRSSRSKPEPRS